MDLNKVVNALGNSGAIGGLAGGVAGGALTSALMSKKGKKYGKTLLKAGGLAAVGGLAWKAYQSYQQGQQGQPQAAEGWQNGQPPPNAQAQPVVAVPAAAEASLPAPQAESDFAIDPTDASRGSRGLLLVRAMIAAANADGHIDGAEQQRILERLQSLGLDADEKALVVDELLKPCTQDQVVAEVRDQATAIEVYAASALAVGEHEAVGQAYLDALAARLTLPPVLIDAISSKQPAGSEQAA